MINKILNTILFMMLFAVLFTTATIEAKADSGEKIRISVLKQDETSEAIGNYNSFEDGWNKAMELASDQATFKKNNYNYIVVDLLSNWTAVDGQFTKDFFNGPGFDWDAIYLPEGARVILNMNGYTIDRGLTSRELNGEVMCIDEGATVIINGDNGTITGGASSNGAGGIHIQENAVVTINDLTISNNSSSSAGAGIYIDEDSKVTLNNVTISDNELSSLDSGYGVSIAVFDGASLTMNGGVISNNILNGANGNIYVEDATVAIDSVDFFGNEYKEGYDQGVILYVCDDSQVVMENCNIYNNAVTTRDNMPLGCSLISLFDDANFTMNDCQIYQNGTKRSYILDVAEEDVQIAISNSEFFENDSLIVFFLRCGKKFDITDSNFYDNAGTVIYAPDYTTIGTSVADGGIVSNCTFNNNGNELGESSFNFEDATGLYFDNCDFGDSTFKNKEYAEYSLASADASVGSIFANGFIGTLISMIALIVAFVTMVIVITDRKQHTKAN